MLVLALVSVGWIGIPAWKGAKFLLRSPRLHGRRPRALVFAGGALALVLAVTFLVPLPLRTRTEGVVWIPEEAHVRAATDGFVEAVVATPGQQVAPGDVLIRCADPDLATEVRFLRARVGELEARRAAVRHEDPSEAAVLDEELRYTRERLERSRQRQAELGIRSRVAGTFVAPLAERLPGRYVRRGERLADVVDLEAVAVRAVVSQPHIHLVSRPAKPRRGFEKYRTHSWHQDRQERNTGIVSIRRALQVLLQ